MARALATAISAAVLLAAACSSSASHPATTYAAFAGTWNGHDRALTISASGAGKESVSDGCCTPEVDLTFQLSNVRASASSTQASLAVTSVTVHSGYTSGQPVPKVGDLGTLNLQDGIVTDSLTGITYCDAAQQAKSACGA